MFPPETDAQLAEAQRLRALGLPYVAIAKAIGVADGTAWKMLNPRPPKPKAPSPPPISKNAPRLLPPTIFHGSIPIQRHVTFTERNSPQPTRNEMYATLHKAVLATRGRRS
jgi:hypothetical protein